MLGVSEEQIEYACKVLQFSEMDTPLGSLMIIADDEAVYLVDFLDRRGLEKELERFQKKTGLLVVAGKSIAARKIEKELEEYFLGKMEEFTTPLLLIGSPFQKRVWQELQKIPCGQTRSYRGIAIAIGKPLAFRAVALANSANPFTIVIPCHRVINHNGNLGGYGGGVKRKEWLLEHEKKLA